MLDGAAEVAAREARDVVEVADGERLVEAQVLAQRGDGVLGGVLAQHQRHRVTRQQIDRQHDDEHHAEQDGHREQQAADDERQHSPESSAMGVPGRSERWPGSPRGRSPLA